DAELIFSWDDYDKLRKIPSNVPDKTSEYIGMPLAEVPDPFECHDSYATHFEEEFEEAAENLGVDVKFINQSEMYKSNAYYEKIKTAMQQRKKIAEILSKFKTQGMSEEEIENFYPLQVYCRKCRKNIGTQIEDYDGENQVKYSCECGHSETADISKENIGKLGWKIDWPMRWDYESVSFEPGGKDHSTPGGSYDVAKEIAREVFGNDAPVYQGYAFIGTSGGSSKMSGSEGGVITPTQLLQIYEPSILRWLFTSVSPENRMTISLGPNVIRQYEEYDREVENYNQGELSPEKKRAIELAKIDPNEKLPTNRASFRQVATFDQVSRGKLSMLKKMLSRVGEDYNEERLKMRAEKARNWVKNHFPAMKIDVRDKPNLEYYEKLSEEERKELNELGRKMTKKWDREKLTELTYEIPKKEDLSDSENKKRQKRFFQNTYQMLIDSKGGPRLGTFLIGLGKEKSKKLLYIDD
ncbi:MAG: lysine--tRNA ligase, partial [Halanaerobiales bacterium]